MENKLLDRAGDVRSEDMLDVAAVAAYVKAQLPDVAGELTVKQYRGGASNMTYELTFANAQFILRCPPLGTKAKGAHDMAREFKLLQRLKPVYPVVPGVVAFCADEAVIGREFYLMEKLTGIIPRANLPKALTLNEREVQQLCLHVVDELIALHRVDINATGLHEFGKGAGYCRRQIEGWTERYAKAHTWNVTKANFVTGWLKDNIPAGEKSCFIHNDFRFDNVVLAIDDPMKIVGVLDWEMATVGDPLMDLGNSLAYWVQADDDPLMKLFRRQPTHLPGMLKRKEVVEYYCDKMGYAAQDFTFYEVYGLFRLAVIVQQIYYRYHHRQTRNPAYKYFWVMTNYLNWRCRRLIRAREATRASAPVV